MYTNEIGTEEYIFGTSTGSEDFLLEFPLNTPIELKTIYIIAKSKIYNAGTPGGYPTATKRLIVNLCPLEILNPNGYDTTYEESKMTGGHYDIIPSTYESFFDIPSCSYCADKTYII